MRCERDAFDTLFDHAPDKLQVSPKTVCIFIDIEISQLDAISVCIFIGHIGIEISQLDVNRDPFSVDFLMNDL
jgi:hypothetical protein